VPFKANADRRHHIPKQRDRITNWSEYDAALRQRGSVTVWFSEEAIAAWRAEPRTTPGGQPHYSALAITAALTLRTVFRLALRQTEGLIGSVIRLLGLDLAIPDHSTLSRRAETLAVAGPPSSAEPMHLLVDSTGLKLSGAGEWLVEKHGTTRRRCAVAARARDCETRRIATATAVIAASRPTLIGLVGDTGRRQRRMLRLPGNPCTDVDRTMSTDPKRILILGGGFAGVYTARCLEKLLRSAEASITLINRENYWVYQPMLPEVISGSIGLSNVVSPIRRLCPLINLVMRRVEEIDLGIGKGFGAGDAERARRGEILHLADHRRLDTLAGAEQVDRLSREILRALGGDQDQRAAAIGHQAAQQ
jgi:hypothetical protein